MIEDRAVQRLSGDGQSPRRPAIRLAWPGITAGVVVGKHDAGAAVTHRIGDNRFQREVRRMFAAVVMADVQAPRFIIDMRNEQPFDATVGIGKAAGEKALSGP